MAYEFYNTSSSSSQSLSSLATSVSNGSYNEYVMLYECKTERILNRIINYRLPKSISGYTNVKTNCDMCENDHKMKIFNRICAYEACHVKYRITMCVKLNCIQVYQQFEHDKDQDYYNNTLGLDDFFKGKVSECMKMNNFSAKQIFNYFTKHFLKIKLNEKDEIVDANSTGDYISFPEIKQISGFISRNKSEYSTSDNNSVDSIREFISKRLYIPGMKEEEGFFFVTNMTTRVKYTLGLALITITLISVTPIPRYFEVYLIFINQMVQFIMSMAHIN